DGRIDWLCLPRFDSDACFAALVGTDAHGYWSLDTTARVLARRRAYRGETLTLETEITTDRGAVRVLDFMPPRGQAAEVVRLVVGLRGEVPMHTCVAPRFGYGAITPWILPHDDGAALGAGPDALRLATPAPLRMTDGAVESTFTVRADER